jgi:type IV secretory pathway VirB9-like protein
VLAHLLKEIMKIIAAIAVLAALIASETTFAATTACSVDLKPGVTAVSVKSNQVIDLCLPAGEKITDLAIGNSDTWLVAANKDTGRMMVKISGSTGPVLETNMIVLTDKALRYEVKLAKFPGTDTN